MLLDFEKAYDIISWNFVQSVLEKRGFHQDFIKGVMALYTNATSAVLVNGEVGERFDITRSVRHGCPLAPFLFIVVMDACRFMLNDSKYGVKGFRLPNGKRVLDASFVDDTSPYLLGIVRI